MSMRALSLVLPLALVAAGCTSPPDAPTRSGGPTGLQVQLTEPRTCLASACLIYDPRLGRVSQPEREPLPIPDGMVDADGFLSSSDFNELVRRTRMADPMEVGLTRLMAMSRPGRT